MRKSNELHKSDTCVKKREIVSSGSNNASVFSTTVRSICVRLLSGELIPDVKKELEERLEQRGYIWENQIQKSKTLTAYFNYITRYVKSEGRPITKIPANAVVKIHGEEVQVLPDFIIEHGDNIEVCKLRIGNPTTKRESEESLELYSYLAWAREAYPHAKNISASYYFLKGQSDTGKNGKFTLDYYDPEATDKRHAIHWTPKLEEKFAPEFEELYHPTKPACPEDCSMCSQKNICGYKEAKIPNPDPKEVKPLGDILLTNDQEAAIDFEKGTARINAGAGAGKTLVVAMRIVSLLSKGVKPEEIALLTFTNSGAMEMTERVKRYCEEMGLDSNIDLITSSTFNSFCQSIIDERYTELGFLSSPTVIEDENKCSIVKRILDRYDEIKEFDYVNFTMNEGYATKGALWSVIEAFAQIKEKGYDRLNNPFALSEPSKDILFAAYEDFNNTMKSQGYIEYADQLQLVFELLKLDPTLFDKMGFKHIIVDEFQDTDLQQIELLNQMIDTPSHESFMAVGDDSQAIFSFRNTSPEFLINFGKYFGQGFVDFYLLDNHRSQANIIDLANKINALNVNRVQKDLVASKPAGDIPWTNGFYTHEEEYEWIINEIKKKIDGGKNPSDICFIASNRYELQKMADMLTKVGIPAIMMNPEPYIENSKVLAILDFAKSFKSGTVDGITTLLNVYLKGELLERSDSEINDMVQHFSDQLSSLPTKNKASFLDIIEQLDPDQNDELFQNFLDKLKRKRSLDDIYQYLSDFELYGQRNCYKKEARYDGVVLTTAHSSKGLEWDTVYCSLSKFDASNLHEKKNLALLEEKRRLLFVTLTRAKEELYITGEYAAYTNDKEGRIYNQFLRECYQGVGRVFAPDPNQYFMIQKQKQQEAAEARAKAKGIKLDELVERTPYRIKLEEGLQAEFEKLNPGKNFLVENKYKSFGFLSNNDLKEYAEMYAHPNAMIELTEMIAKEFPGRSIEDVTGLTSTALGSNRMKSTHIRNVIANVLYLKDKTEDDLKSICSKLSCDEMDPRHLVSWYAYTDEQIETKIRKIDAEEKKKAAILKKKTASGTKKTKATPESEAEDGEKKEEPAESKDLSDEIFS